MDNNYFDLQGGGGIIDPDFCDERCALRNLFGLAISPQTPLSPLVEAIGARPVSCALGRCQSLAE